MATRKNSAETTPDSAAPEAAGPDVAASAPAPEAPRPAPRKRGPKPRLPEAASAAASAPAPSVAKPAGAKRGPKPGSKRTPNAEAARKPAAGTPRTPAAKGGRKPATPPAAATARTFAWPLGGLALAAGAGLIAFLTRGRIAALVESATATVSASKPTEGHVPTDLLNPDRNADDRAVADFRPNMDAPMTAGEREALAPATGPSPSLVADRGEMNMQTGPSQ